MKKTITQTAMYKETEETRAKYAPFPTDPVRYAEAQADNIVEFYRKQGLLKQIKDARPPKNEAYLFIRLRNACYSVRQPVKNHEQVTVDKLLELDKELRRLRREYPTNQPDATFTAIRIGWTLALATALQFDPDVKYGRPGLRQLTKNRQKATANRRRDRAPVWAEIVAHHARGLTWGQIEAKGFARSTIARALRRHKANLKK